MVPSPIAGQNPMGVRALKRWAVFAALAWSPVLVAAQPADAVKSEQFGTVRWDFELGEAKGFVIPATAPADEGSNPWVWYAPTFIGRHPDDSHTWLAKRLLGAGFAIAGVDVGESFGSPAGTNAYAAFYGRVRKDFGLNPKPCLLAQSRGGLMLLNWASENPDRVQCIAGIYAVCNLESYPGLEKAAPAYGTDSATLRQELRRFNPIDRLKSLAEADVPLFFIHGDSDKTVPLEANAGELVARYRALGGPARLEVVAGKGHEVCPEFFESQALLEFLIGKGGREGILGDGQR
jgi:pimeloyl-ACP methyl ester carboxylesterase